VVTPCYNASATLAETIASVAGQRYPAIEHIVVDDASTDGSWQVIEAHRDRVIGLHLSENGGGARARNRGAALARGEYLVFLDADDLMGPEAVGELVAAVRDHPGTIGYCGWLRWRQVRGQWQAVPTEIPMPDPAGDPLRGWLQNVWVPPCAVLWRRDSYERSGGWDERLTLNDDGELMMRALARGARLLRANGGESYYRDHHGTRLTVSNDVTSERKFQSRVRSYRYVMDELVRQNRLEEYAPPLGVMFHQLAEFAFREGYPLSAYECLAMGNHLVGPRAVSRTWLGRRLTGILGLERKERVLNALARLGLGGRKRRQALRMRALPMAADGAVSAGPVGGPASDGPTSTVSVAE
jgi:glycosyltransferase involved in cell wall biosynthesis